MHDEDSKLQEQQESKSSSYDDSTPEQEQQHKQQKVKKGRTHLKDPRKIPGTPNDFFGLAGFLVIILGILFVGTYISNHATTGDHKNVNNHRGSRNLARETKTNQSLVVSSSSSSSSFSKHHIVYKQKTVGCGLYSAPSTIPIKDRYMGLYSANEYTPGNTIIETMTTVPALHNNTTIEIPQYLLLMRFHPTFHNVRFVKMNTTDIHHNDNTNMARLGGSLIATQHIRPGHELLFNIDDLEESVSLIYQHAIFTHHPTKETYHRVDEIIKDVITSIPIITAAAAGGGGGYVNPHPKSRKNISTNSNNANQQQRQVKQRSFQRTVDISPILHILKKTLLFYDEKVAYLLPKSEDAAEKIFLFGSNTSNHVVHPHRPIEWVYDYGACVDGVSTNSSTLSSSTIQDGLWTVYSTRKISQGDVIITAPLFSIHKSIMEMKQELWKEYCPFLQEEVYLCPLTLANLIPQGIISSLSSSSSSSDITLTSNTECNNNSDTYESCNQTRLEQLNRGIASSSTNARFSWSNISPWHAGTNNYLSSYYFDFIATRDIQEGEEVRKSFQYRKKKSSHTSIHVSGSLIGLCLSFMLKILAEAYVPPFK